VRTGLARVVVAALVASSAGCGGSLRYDDGGDLSPTLVVRCSSTCFVLLDGEPVALVESTVVVPVREGSNRVTVAAAGYLTSRFDVVARRGQSVTLDVQLWPAD
jgi:hypothetical protein